MSYTDGTHKFLTTQQLAKRYGMTAHSVRMWRYRRQGPPFIKIANHVLYRLDWLIEWESTQKVKGLPDPVAQELTELGLAD